MSFGDSNHILVGRSVADSLMPRDKYSKSFRRYVGTAKHNTSMEVYQYTGGRIADLNRDPPNIFASPVEKVLTEYAAYYIAAIIRNREFIEKTLKEESYRNFHLALQMAYLAADLLGQSKETLLKPYDNRMPKTPNNTLQEQLEFFNKLPWEVMIDLHGAKLDIFIPYLECFEEGELGLYSFVSKKGEEKLKREWPRIYKELNTK